MKKISVIIPMYNVEQYLEKCVTSVLEQTYENIELILVDDGSPDNCGKICDDFALRDKRIVVIHKKNGGLSSARNAGLDVATGDYIGFVDSDDWIEPTMYEKLVELLEGENCDMAECAVNLVSKDSFKLYDKQDNEIVSGIDALRRQLDFSPKTATSLPRIAVWSKLFKRDFWAGKRFPVGEIHEDYLLVTKAFYTAKKVGFVKVGLYNHLVDNPNSIINSRFSTRDLYKEKQYYFRYEYLKQNIGGELLELSKAKYYDVLIETYWQCLENHLKEKDDYLEKIIHMKTDILKSVVLPRKRKYEVILICFSPNLYYLIRHCYNYLRTYL